jgi:hypothetical protein
VGASRSIILSLLTAATVATPVFASDDDWPVIKGSRLDDQRPWAAFAVYKPDTSTGISLYLRGGKDAPVLVARRVSTHGDKAVVDWAASPDCPQLLAAATEMEDLPVPRIEAPGVGHEPRGGALVLDGDSYFLWADDARFSAGAHSAQLELRAVNGSPVADWIDRALAGLSGCWRASLS